MPEFGTKSPENVDFRPFGPIYLGSSETEKMGGLATLSPLFAPKVRFGTNCGPLGRPISVFNREFIPFRLLSRKFGQRPRRVEFSPLARISSQILARNFILLGLSPSFISQKAKLVQSIQFLTKNVKNWIFLEKNQNFSFWKILIHSLWLFRKFEKVIFNTQSLFLKNFCNFLRYLPTNFCKNFQKEPVY